MNQDYLEATKNVYKEAAGRIKHTYSWIVLTEAWCGDSAQILPVITAITKLNPQNIKLYILLRDENPWLMNKFLTDGTRLIPSPRPAPAQELLRKWKNNQAGKTWAEFEKDLHTWYAKDKTQTTQAEFLDLLNGLS